MHSGRRLTRKAPLAIIFLFTILWCWSTSGISGAFHHGRCVGTSAETIVGVPLLPVVFFDSASSDIPERYDVEPLSGGSSTGTYRTLHDAYLRVLDVLAEQLVHSNDHVVLQGYEERSGSIDECYLARARAERIKNYLVHDRGIQAWRIRVNHSNIDCIPPEITMKGGSGLSCEYRRVEILTPERRPFPITLRTSPRQAVTSMFRDAAIVLFDLRSEYIRKSQRADLSQFLDQLPVDSELRVTGHTDVIGRSESGPALGAQRALGVAALTRQQRPDCRISLLNMNPSRRPPLGLPAIDLPEIRYLSRSVIVQRIPSGGTR